MKKIGLLIVVVALIFAIPVVCSAMKGQLFQKVEMEQISYTVKPYDTLYSIAADLGIENWRKWSYDVRKLNNIQNGGEIFVGDEIIILVEKGLK